MFLNPGGPIRNSQTLQIFWGFFYNESTVMIITIIITKMKITIDFIYIHIYIYMYMKT